MLSKKSVLSSVQLQGDALHYITLETINSGHSKSNFKDHSIDAAKEQCLGMIAKKCVFSF